MPPLETKLQDDFLLRVLVFGPARTKKTWWAGKAAEAGFNVFIADGGEGYHILNNISPEGKKRIHVIACGDGMGDPAFAKFMTYLCKGSPFVWSEKHKNRVQVQSNCKEDSAHYLIDITRMTANDVVVVDEWTALSWSLAWRYSNENGIDLTDPEKTDWEGYRWCGQIATWMLAQLKNFPCHVIVIGHEDTYEKRRQIDKKTTVVEWSRRQIKSISGPHAMQMPAKFSDVLTFEMVGSSFKISASLEKDKDGGSRVVPPGTYNWEDLQFKDIIAKYAHLPLPKDAPPSEGCIYFPPGEIPDFTTLGIGSSALNTLGLNKGQGNGSSGEQHIPQTPALNSPAKKASFANLLHTKTPQKTETERDPNASG